MSMITCFTSPGRGKVYVEISGTVSAVLSLRISYPAGSNGELVDISQAGSIMPEQYIIVTINVTHANEYFMKRGFAFNTEA